MKIYTSIENVRTALELVNEKYDGNISFKRLENIGIRKNIVVATLKVENSRGLGAKIGFTGRRTVSACWHVHGDFIDALMSIDPETVVIALKKKITADKGNWIDMDVGSVINPMYMSEMCEC